MDNLFQGPWQPAKAENIDQYIATFPNETQAILQQIRSIIKKVAPKADEKISYGIPTFNLNGTYLIYFAAYKKHIALYPVPSKIETIGKEFTSYKTSGKGTIQFQLNEPMPYHLITKIVKYKLQENIKKSDAKKEARKQ